MSVKVFLSEMQIFSSFNEPRKLSAKFL